MPCHFQVPDTAKWKIEAEAFLEHHEIEREIEPVVGREEILELSLFPDFRVEEEGPLLVLFEGQLVADDGVSLNSEIIDATNEDGDVTFVVATWVEKVVSRAESSALRVFLTV